MSPATITPVGGSAKHVDRAATSLLIGGDHEVGVPITGHITNGDFIAEEVIRESLPGNSWGIAVEDQRASVRDPGVGAAIDADAAVLGLVPRIGNDKLAESVAVEVGSG